MSSPDAAQREMSQMTTKLRSISKGKGGRPPLQITALQLDTLHHRILVLETTTSCVEMVLLGQHDSDPTEIVTLMIQDIVDELGLVGEVVERLIGTVSAAHSTRKHPTRAGRPTLPSAATK